MKMRQVSAVSSVACSCIMSACVGAPDPASDPPREDRMAQAVSREVKTIALQRDRNVDLLFMIDNSPSTRDKQINLASNFPGLVAALGALPGGLPNLHLGVVTSDLGTKGTLDASPGPAIGAIGQGGCSGLGQAGALQVFGAQVTGGRFLSDVADDTGARVRNYAGTLAGAFSQIAQGVGTGGCGFEQPLEAVKQALAPGNAGNAGFLRPDAVLGVVILSDEDDCSLAHSSLLAASTAVLGPLQSFRCTRFGIVCDQGGASSDAMNQVGAKAQCHPADASAFLTGIADYVQFLTQLKPDPSKLVLGAIVGPAEPVATELRAVAGVGTIPSLAHSCSYLGGDVTGDGVPDLAVADPAIRIKALLDQFPGHSALSTICQQDLSGSLAQVGALLEAGLGDPCITGELAPLGSVPSCTVFAAGADTSSATTLPVCPSVPPAAGDAPCWHLVSDPASCPAGDHVYVAIEGQAQLPAGIRVTATCAVDR